MQTFKTSLNNSGDIFARINAELVNKFPKLSYLTLSDNGVLDLFFKEDLTDEEIAELEQFMEQYQIIVA